MDNILRAVDVQINEARARDDMQGYRKLVAERLILLQGLHLPVGEVRLLARVLCPSGGSEEEVKQTCEVFKAQMIAKYKPALLAMYRSRKQQEDTTQTPVQEGTIHTPLLGHSRPQASWWRMLCHTCCHCWLVPRT